MSTRRVIPDTNIWYHVDFTPEFGRSNSITATQAVIQEMCSSGAMLHDIALVRKGLLKTKTNVSNVIYYDPLRYILHKSDGTLKEAKKIYPGLFESGLAISKGLVIPEEKREKVKLDLFNDKKVLHDFSKMMNSRLVEARLQISDPKLHIQADESIYKYLLVQLINSTTESQLTIIDIEWEMLELFIKTWMIYFYELEIDRTMKIQTNDFVDLFLLAYVGKNDLFWTNDKAWIRRIKNAGLEHYLFNC